MRSITASWVMTCAQTPESSILQRFDCSNGAICIASRPGRFIQISAHVLEDSTALPSSCSFTGSHAAGAHRCIPSFSSLQLLVIILVPISSSQPLGSQKHIILYSSSSLLFSTCCLQRVLLLFFYPSSTRFLTIPRPAS